MVSQGLQSFPLCKESREQGIYLNRLRIIKKFVYHQMGNPDDNKNEGGKLDFGSRIGKGIDDNCVQG